MWQTDQRAEISAHAFFSAHEAKKQHHTYIDTIANCWQLILINEGWLSCQQFPFTKNMQDPSLHLILLGLMISTQKSKKPLFVTIFYHGYHLSYVKEPSQCPGIWNQKKKIFCRLKMMKNRRSMILSPDSAHMFNNSCAQCTFSFSNKL